MQQVPRFLALVENSSLAIAMRENDVLFPLIESVHVVALCLVVGSILAVDMRLLGLASTNHSLDRVTGSILPLTWTAFAMAVVSGSLLFISHATAYLNNDFFVAKMCLIVAAGLNMAIFHRGHTKNRSERENATSRSFRARLAGGLSVLVWIAIVTCGRWIGYTMPIR